LTAAETTITAMAIPIVCTWPPRTSRWGASKVMIAAPKRISVPSITPAMFSIFSWP
jgi:hypothetical protein